jgi:hypothetical protein
MVSNEYYSKMILEEWNKNKIRHFLTFPAISVYFSPVNNPW